jgi:hypothetical protein
MIFQFAHLHHRTYEQQTIIYTYVPVSFRFNKKQMGLSSNCRW